MSFAYFDNILTLLAEEINVPLPKLQQAWTNSFVKFYKADASILQAPAKKGTKTTDKPKKDEAKSSSKLPICQDPDGCTIGVKNQVEVNGKIYCSKHLKKAQNAIKKEQAAKCEYLFPKDHKKAGAQCGNNALPDGSFCRNHASEAEKSSTSPKHKEEDEKQEELPEELDDEEESLESDDETVDPQELLVKLSQGLDGFIGKKITPENYSKAGTMEKYLTFFKTNWHNFQIIYPDLISVDAMETMADQKKLQKWDLISLLEKRNPKLEQ